MSTQGKTAMKNTIYATYDSRFHGGRKIYEGASLQQAIRAGRKDPCAKWDTECQCGGPLIFAEENGQHYQIHAWQATKPFHAAGKIAWERI